MIQDYKGEWYQDYKGGWHKDNTGRNVVIVADHYAISTDDDVDAAEAIVREQYSGERREFDTGAVRDIQEGKGRCDLLPLGIVEVLLGDPKDGKDDVIEGINMLISTGDTSWLYAVIFNFRQKREWTIEDCILEVAKHFEEGAKKYGEYNWQKGIPAHCYIDSAIRHYIKWRRGDDDEPHDRAFVWNIMCLMWTLKNMPEMNDITTPRNKK